MEHTLHRARLAHLTHANLAHLLARRGSHQPTEQILAWWAAHGTGEQCPITTWAKAARMVFAMSPNSASCERVFALLKSMFGEEQM